MAKFWLILSPEILEIIKLNVCLEHFLIFGGGFEGIAEQTQRYYCIQYKPCGWSYSASFAVFSSTFVHCVLL